MPAQNVRWHLLYAESGNWHALQLTVKLVGLPMLSVLREKWRRKDELRLLSLSRRYGRALLLPSFVITSLAGTIFPVQALLARTCHISSLRAGLYWSLQAIAAAFSRK